MTIQPPPKSGSCLYCGNNPTPHWLNWYTATVDIMFSGLRRKVFYNSLSIKLERFVEQLPIWDWLMWLSERVALIRFTADAQNCVSSRGAVLWEEAKRRGITMEAMVIFGKTVDAYRIQRGDQKMRFMGLPRPMHDGETLEILDDKWEMKRRFRAAGIPTPAGETVITWSAAQRVFEQLSKPVIVKPRTGSRGRHTTTFIYTLDDLRKGFKRAKRLCMWVIIEEHLDGPVYRGTVIDYTLQGVLRGDPPSVLGDGVHSIRDLVNLRNEIPHPGVADINVSASTHMFLARQNLTIESVLPTGKEVFLTEKIGVSYGGSSSEDYHICHPETKELFVQAAHIMGDPVVGFDFIIPDITRSYKEQRSGFIECNSLPFINLHHDPLLGVPRNVAAAVWDLAGYPARPTVQSIPQETV